MPKWNPTNVCSYHLQEAGATPVQELAFALATAQAVLDAVKASGEVAPDDFGAVVGRISFFVNAGLRFITEICKMRAFSELWDEITAERYGVSDPKHRLFRYGVQVNSLGLTEPQAENNVYRILIEMLAVTLSRDARARAVQLPAWNEALGLPRPWDQQWSLRMQQILAYETDLLEYPDILDGSKVVRRKVDELKAAAKEELARIEAMGGAVAAIDYMKRALVESNTERVRRIEAGEQIVVGVNRWTETEASPAVGRRRLGPGGRCRRSRPSRSSGSRPGARRATPRPPRRRWPSSSARPARAATSWSRRSPAPRPASRPASGARRCARVFGEYRAPTGITGGVGAAASSSSLDEVRGEVERVSARLGRRIKLLVGKPGLDGHSNGAEQIAVRARDCGMEVVYEGIRLTPAQIVRAAVDEAVHVVGLSILSGSHVPLVADVMQRMRKEGLDDVAGRGRRHHPAGGRRRRSRASASPPSTRRRTSSSTPSCATSCAWWTATPRRRERVCAVIPAPRVRASALAEEGRDPCTSR